MLNVIIPCDGPMMVDRLLYGEPDPWLAQFECRHDVGYQHHHNEVNPPTGPGGPEPEPEPEPPDACACACASRAGTVRAIAGTGYRVAEPARKRRVKPVLGGKHLARYAGGA